MTTRLNPYINFRGTAHEAMTFYQSVLGGQLEVNRFADLGGMGAPDHEQQWVMHSALTVSDSVVLMGSDLPSSMPAEIKNGTISISGDDEVGIRGWFDGLAEGGTIDFPLEKAPWGDHFGQLTDRFGICWMFNVGTTPEV